MMSDEWTRVVASKVRTSNKESTSSRQRHCRYKAYVFFCLFVSGSINGKLDPHFIVEETSFGYQKYGFPGGSFKTKSVNFENLSEDEQRDTVVDEAQKEVDEELPGMLSALQYQIDPDNVDWIGPHSSTVTNTRGKIIYVAAYLFANITSHVMARLNIRPNLDATQPCIPESEMNKVHALLLDPVNARLLTQRANNYHTPPEVVKVHLIGLGMLLSMARAGDIWKPHADVVNGVAPMYHNAPPGMKGRPYADVMQRSLSCASQPPEP